MTMVSKNVCIVQLDEIVDKYNKTYHWKIKMKLADVKLGICIEYGVDKEPSFKTGDYVRIC